jgi:hypothetical protein
VCRLSLLPTEASQLSEAAALLKPPPCSKLTRIKDFYNPTEDGFVFSTTEIETFISRRDRLKAAAANA